MEKGRYQDLMKALDGDRFDLMAAEAEADLWQGRWWCRCLEGMMMVGFQTVVVDLVVAGVISILPDTAVPGNGDGSEEVGVVVHNRHREGDTGEGIKAGGLEVVLGGAIEEGKEQEHGVWCNNTPVSNETGKGPSRTRLQYPYDAVHKQP